LGGQIKKKDMDGAYITYGREERCIQDFGGKPEGKRSLGNLGLQITNLG
jgi:hypothetical protein